MKRVTLSGQALQASKVSYEPMINNSRGPNADQGRATEGTGNQAGQEARGDVLVHGLWETGSGCILDICISDTDARSYADKTSKQVLEDHAKRKKSKTHPLPVSHRLCTNTSPLASWPAWLPVPSVAWPWFALGPLLCRWDGVQGGACV